MRNERETALAARTPEAPLPVLRHILRLRRRRELGEVCLAFLLASAFGPGCAGRGQKPASVKEEEEVVSFALYALSRGTGVPDEAREALAELRAILEQEREEGVRVSFAATRIGLEGETRLCAVFEDPAAGAAVFRRAQELVEGVDLLNLVIESCDKGNRGFEQWEV